MLIKCINCQKNISNQAFSCPHCGQNYNNETFKIRILGWNQFFLIKPKVDIYFNNNYVGSVGKNDYFEKEINRQTHVLFKCYGKTKKILVNGMCDIEIKLKWDRIYGRLLLNGE